MTKEPKIAVIGGGSWGTAIIKILLGTSGNVNWWIRNPETIAYIKQYQRNPNYLRYLELDTNRLSLSSDLKQVINDSDYIIFAIPAAFLNTALTEAGIDNLQQKTIISAIKGIVPETNSIVSDYFHKQFNVDYNNIGIIGGPCHSEEVAMEKLSFLTIAFQDQAKAEFFASKLASRYMKITITHDIWGTEYAAVLKNIIAIANGISIGLAYGDNFQSVLIVNGIQEVKRFLDKINKIERDINNAVYLGDIIVTAYSKFSRNRMLGSMIGKGYSLKSALVEMKMVAEGYYAVKGIHELNKTLKVHMPITEAVYNILYEGISPFIEMKILSDKIK